MRHKRKGVIPEEGEDESSFDEDEETTEEEEDSEEEHWDSEAEDEDRSAKARCLQSQKVLKLIC